MKTSEILNRSADIIQERGWTQGSWSSGEGTPVCLEGGIVAAMGVGNPYDEPMDPHEFWTCPAYRAVQTYLDDAHRYPEYVYSAEWQRYRERLRREEGDLHEGLELWRFNDAEERTAEEVIEVLRAVAVIEEARERAEEKVEVPA